MPPFGTHRHGPHGRVAALTTRVLYDPPVMTALNPTPGDRLVDREGRPYFLWDMDMTRAQFEQRLCDPDRGVRAYFVGKLMRQAKPDDVFTFVTTTDLANLWPDVQRYLGRTHSFWNWLMRTWKLAS